MSDGHDWARKLADKIVERHEKGGLSVSNAAFTVLANELSPLVKAIESIDAKRHEAADRVYSKMVNDMQSVRRILKTIKG